MDGSKVKEFDIDREQKRTILTVVIAVAIAVFCLLSSKALLSQAAYHRHVLGETRKSVAALKENISSVDTLKKQYDSFNSTNPNVIGGNNSPSLKDATPPDGTNSQIVLNALPTNYDFPALISSVTKVLSVDNIANPGISGTDASATVNSTASTNPSPVPINVSISGLTSYSGAQNLIKDLERSVRPFDVTKIQLSGGSSAMTISASLTTHFQPAKILNTSTKEVK